MEELKGQKAGSDVHKDMLSILMRETAEPGICSDAEPHQDLNGRFDGIDLDDESEEATADLMSRLTAEEKQQFEHMVRTGQITSLIPDMKTDPWWLTFKPKLVEQVSESTVTGFGCRRDLVNRLPELTSICKKEPSLLIKYSVINVLISYCSACRRFAGDHMSLSDEFVQELLLGSAVLSEAAVFQSTSTAMHHCSHQLIHELKLSTKEVRTLFQDVRIIAGDKNLVLELLADIWFVLNKCLSAKCDKEHRSTLKRLQKKVEFMIAWCKKRGADLHDVVREVEYLTVRLPVDEDDVDPQSVDHKLFVVK